MMSLPRKLRLARTLPASFARSRSCETSGAGTLMSSATTIFDRAIASKTTNNGRRRRRTGIILAVVLVALLVVMLLAAAFANLFIAQRKLVRQTAQQQQVFWLAEAALNRAVYRLSKDPSYDGETWQLPIDSLDRFKSANATIRVESAEEQQQGDRIFVEAQLTTQGGRSVVHHRDLFVMASAAEPE